MFGTLKKIIGFVGNDRYKPFCESIDIDKKNTYGLIGSTHGNVIAYKKIIDYLINDIHVDLIFHCGDIMDEHAGYIECLEMTIDQPKIKSVVGNHDLLLINQDDIHNYAEEYIQLANKAFVKLKKFPRLIDAVMNMPSMIRTKYFSIVHESVEYPYYAKITKLKKKSFGYGKSPDENYNAVFNSALPHPFISGSDHQSYLLEGPIIKKRFIKPDETIVLRGSKFLSLPSVSLSKDINFVHGFGILKINEDDSIEITVKDIPEILISGDDII